MGSLGADDQPDGRSDDASLPGAFRSPGVRGAERWIALQLQGAGTVSIFIDTQLRTPFGVRNGQFDADPYMSNYISPYISSTELLARLHVRDVAGALDLLRRTYGHMADTDPNTTMWEKMNFGGDAANYAPNQAPSPTNVGVGAGMTSLAHGWSGGPVPALSSGILGIGPTAPGFATWIVDPQPGDLRFAQGQAPTPRGAIIARWERDDRSFRLTAAGPTGGSVIVPELGARRSIFRDGALVWANGTPTPGVRAAQAGDGVRFDGVSGEHTYAWGASPAVCARRRTFVVHLRLPRGARVRRVVAQVGARRVQARRRGRGLLTQADLRGLRPGFVRVRLVATCATAAESRRPGRTARASLAAALALGKT